jgi:hypothetical protein
MNAIVRCLPVQHGSYLRSRSQELKLSMILTLTWSRYTDLRLSRVYIENAHYVKVIERFDRPHTFFYIDPPYWGCEDVYGEGIYTREDFGHLKDVLSGIKGKFILRLGKLTPHIMYVLHQ